MATCASWPPRRKRDSTRSTSTARGIRRPAREPRTASSPTSAPMRLRPRRSSSARAGEPWRRFAPSRHCVRRSRACSTTRSRNTRPRTAPEVDARCAARSRGAHAGAALGARPPGETTAHVVDRALRPTRGHHRGADRRPADSRAVRARDARAGAARRAPRRRSRGAVRAAGPWAARRADAGWRTSTCRTR